MNMSIRKKIFISFFLLNAYVFLFIIILSVNLFQKSNIKFIEFDLTRTKQDTIAYVDQFIKSNEIDMYNTIDENKSALLSELNSKLGVKGLFYDVRGNIAVTDDSMSISPEEKKTDVTLALNNNTHYTISKKKQLANFTMPILVSGEILFVYSMEKDYSGVFGIINSFSRIIIVFGTASLFFVFIISLLVSRNITKPILKLKEYTNRIALHDYDVKIDIKSQDEIHDLANNFKVMQNKIKEHINTIEKDKNLLKELLLHRKKFFDSVTHELKTPLATIQGYTQLLARNGFKDQDFFDKGMNHILEESIRLHKMVLSLLDLSDHNSIHTKMSLEKLNISNLVEKICTDMKFKANDYNVSITTDIVPELNIEGCKDDLKGLFINLIDNAIKYSGLNSTVKIRIVDKNDHIEAVVSDNGQGIPQDMLNKVFEPFFKVDNNKSKKLGSSGLGLSIVKKIVENHNGEINIESNKNMGTKIIVKLPKTEQQ